MSEDYRAMWEHLGLDLEAHDGLLGVLNQAYQNLPGPGRPAGRHGLFRLRHERGARAAHQGAAG